LLTTFLAARARLAPFAASPLSTPLRYAFGITLAEMAVAPAGSGGGGSKLAKLKDDPAAAVPAYVPPQLADLLRGLLAAKPAERLSAAQAAAHPFFEGVDWDGLAAGPAGFNVQLRPAPSAEAVPAAEP
jgi:hypothetical protein